MLTVQQLVDELGRSPECSAVRLVADWIGRASTVDAVDLHQEPPLSSSALTNSLAAAAVEHVALRQGLDVPHWVGGPGRHLDQIWYGGYDALFANALAHTPISFSIRGILIEADSLESV